MTTGTEIELYYKPGEGGDLSGLDQRLLDIYADSPNISPEEAAKQLNVKSMTPARVLQRVREILNSQHTLSSTHQKALLLQDLIKLRDNLWERINEGEEVITKHGDLVSVGTSAAMYNSLRQVFKEWRTLIDSMAADVNNEETKIKGANARAVNDLVSDAFDRFLRTMGEKGLILDTETAHRTMEDSLAIAFHHFTQRNEESTPDVEVVTAEVA